VSTPVGELEIVEQAEETGPGDLLHAYCSICLEQAHPAGVLSMCGQAGPRNDDDMAYDRLTDCPPEDVCVVCVEVAGRRCPECGH
jgi:hypothetical protein